MATHTLIVERWVSSFDFRTCPICLFLHGSLYAEGDGPQPPLHPGCRCRREFAYRLTVEEDEEPKIPRPLPYPYLPWPMPGDPLPPCKEKDKRPKDERDDLPVHQPDDEVCP